VLPVCQQTLDDRYPFNRRSKSEVGISDFSRMFAVGGLLDTFFNENLARYVDTEARPNWLWKKVNDAELGISEQVLIQFQYAAEIRAAFFPNGNAPEVGFSITPQAFDTENAKRVTLSIEGKEIVFSSGDDQPDPVGVKWPGEAGFAQIVFEPEAKNIENRLRKEGPWAWFRLLDAAEVRGTNNSDEKRLIFNVGGRVAVYTMRSDSALNPFALAALAKFSCPKSF
jgi:type VI secretion system protein ImpL